MLPSKIRFTRLLSPKIASLVVALTLATGAAVTTAAPAGASTEEVRKSAEAAKQAVKALEKAKAEADESARAKEKAAKAKKKASKRVSAAEDDIAAAEQQLVEAREITAQHAAVVEEARVETLSLYREEGLVDVVAEVAHVATGDTDNVVLSTAAGVVKAGLTGVIGPVVSLLDPLKDAVQGHIDDAELAYAQAEQREQDARHQRTLVVGEHRVAATALTEAKAALASATSSVRKAKKAETKAKAATKEASESVESAESKATKAKAAEKKARQEAQEAAERAAERRAAASAQSRSSGDRSTGDSDTSSSSSTSSGRVRPGTGGITSPYGMRTHPITGVHKLHSGTDFGYGDGNAYAAASGTVAKVTYDSAYGNMVTLSHGGGVQSRYAHLSRASVSVGQSVSAGTVVGKIGSTGMSTGPHLHFEVLQGGDFVNPMGWLG